MRKVWLCMMVLVLGGPVLAGSLADYIGDYTTLQGVVILYDGSTHAYDTALTWEEVRRALLDTSVRESIASDGTVQVFSDYQKPFYMREAMIDGHAGTEVRETLLSSGVYPVEGNANDWWMLGKVREHCDPTNDGYTGMIDGMACGALEDGLRYFEVAKSLAMTVRTPLYELEPTSKPFVAFLTTKIGGFDVVVDTFRMEKIPGVTRGAPWQFYGTLKSVHPASGGGLEDALAKLGPWLKEKYNARFRPGKEVCWPFHVVIISGFTGVNWGAIRGYIRQMREDPELSGRIFFHVLNMNANDAGVRANIRTHILKPGGGIELRPMHVFFDPLAKMHGSAMTRVAGACLVRRPIFLRGITGLSAYTTSIKPSDAEFYSLGYTAKYPEGTGKMVIYRLNDLVKEELRVRGKTCRNGCGGPMPGPVWDSTKAARGFWERTIFVGYGVKGEDGTIVPEIGRICYSSDCKRDPQATIEPNIVDLRLNVPGKEDASSFAAQWARMEFDPSMITPPPSGNGSTDNKQHIAFYRLLHFLAGQVDYDADVNPAGEFRARGCDEASGECDGGIVVDDEHELLMWGYEGAWSRWHEYMEADGLEYVRRRPWAKPMAPFFIAQSTNWGLRVIKVERDFTESREEWTYIPAQELPYVYSDAQDGALLGIPPKVMGYHYRHHDYLVGLYERPGQNGVYVIDMTESIQNGQIRLIYDTAIHTPDIRAGIVPGAIVEDPEGDLYEDLDLMVVFPDGYTFDRKPRNQFCMYRVYLDEEPIRHEEDCVTFGEDIYGGAAMDRSKDGKVWVMVHGYEHMFLVRYDMRSRELVYWPVTVKSPWTKNPRLIPEKLYVHESFLYWIGPNKRWEQLFPNTFIVGTWRVNLEKVRSGGQELVIDASGDMGYGAMAEADDEGFVRWKEVAAGKRYFPCEENGVKLLCAGQVFVFRNMQLLNVIKLVTYGDRRGDYTVGRLLFTAKSMDCSRPRYYLLQFRKPWVKYIPPFSRDEFWTHPFPLDLSPFDPHPMRGIVGVEFPGPVLSYVAGTMKSFWKPFIYYDPKKGKDYVVDYFTTIYKGAYRTRYRALRWMERNRRLRRGE